MKPTQAPAPALHTNPTSTGTTVWYYAVIIYLALEHLLHNEPRHVQYRESLKQAQKASPETLTTRPSSSSRAPSFLPKDATRGTDNKIHPQPYRPPSPHPRSNQSSSNSPYRNTYTAPIYPVDKVSTGLSKAQMSDAWARMRAVTRRRVEPVAMYSSMKGTNVKEKVRRHVRWGSVRSYDYEHPYAADDEETENEQDRRAKVKKSERRQGQEVEHRAVGKELEIWGPAKTGGEREIWGSAGIDGEHEIWGDAADNTF